MTQDATDQGDSKERAWAEYWRSATGEKSAVHSPSLNSALEHVWQGLFEDLGDISEIHQVVDLACGTAPVLTQFAHHTDEAGLAPRLYAVDVSPEAIELACQAMDGRDAVFVEGNAGETGLQNGSFDLVLSQFGMEYAGQEGFLEAARLTAPNGRIRAIVHTQDGGISKESENNLDALMMVYEADLLGRIETAIEQSCQPGQGRRDSERALIADARALGTRIAAVADCAGREYSLRLLNDAMTLYERRQVYRPADRAHWLAHQKGALESYIERMESMLGACMTRKELDEIFDRWREQEVSATCDPLIFGRNSETVAWLVQATRSG